jgi:chromosome partitioning protein
MRVLAIVQNKGGVGKTTVARLLSEYFANRNLRVLGIDLDPQCNYSRRFLTMQLDPTDPDGIIPPLHSDYDPIEDTGWNGRSASADIFYDGTVVPYGTRYSSLDILPGHGSRLRNVELVRAEHVITQVHDRIRQFLHHEDVTKSYDLVILDTSPSKGPLTVSAVRAATHLLIPTTMEPQPIEGLYGMLQLWRREQGKRRPSEALQIVGILPNMFRKGVALHEGLFASLQNDQAIAPFLTPCHLAQRIAFAESDHANAAPPSVFELSSRDLARKEAEAVCGYVMTSLGFN